jgi:hypothetical protein
VPDSPERRRLAARNGHALNWATRGMPLGLTCWDDRAIPPPQVLENVGAVPEYLSNHVHRRTQDFGSF